MLRLNEEGRRGNVRAYLHILYGQLASFARLASEQRIGCLKPKSKGTISMFDYPASKTQEKGREKQPNE